MPCLSAGSCHSIDLSYMTFTSNDCPASPQSCGKSCPFSFLLDVGSSSRQEHADHLPHAGFLYPLCHYIMLIGQSKAARKRSMLLFPCPPSPSCFLTVICCFNRSQVGCEPVSLNRQNLMTVTKMFVITAFPK